jgi:hypothetical protein
MCIRDRSEWDNDLPFSENEILAQAWFFGTLKIVMQYIVDGIEPTDVKMLLILNDKVPRELMCFSVLERDNLLLKADNSYVHKDWPKVLNEGYVIPDADFYNIENWIFGGGIKFTVENQIL